MFFKLRTVTATTPTHVILFAGSSRMEKIVMRDFEICSEEFEDPETEVESDPYFRRDYAVEVDSFLAFRGEYELMKLLMKLRFKILNYFMMWLRNPEVAKYDENVALLHCLNEVLSKEHKNCLYARVDDLPTKKEEVVRKQPVRIEKDNRIENSNNNNGTFNQSNGVHHTRNNVFVNSNYQNHTKNERVIKSDRTERQERNEKKERQEFNKQQSTESSSNSNSNNNRNVNRRPDKPIYQPRKRIFQRRRQDPRPEDNSIAVQNEEDEADPSPTSSNEKNNGNDCQQATKFLFDMVQKMQTKPKV